jgi:hypothetical protein
MVDVVRVKATCGNSVTTDKCFPEYNSCETYTKERMVLENGTVIEIWVKITDPECK